jgi:hypothetical protein
MSASEKKVAANRINGGKSHGPKNKTSTRFNATKHGLLAEGISELDDAKEYQILLTNLQKEKAPVGLVETMLVKSIALDITRLGRARRLEAEYITAELNPPTYSSLLPDLCEPTVVDPGIPPAIGFEGGQRRVNVYQRYETTFLNRILRLLHELERLQRMRSGEQLPAPGIVDVSVHAPTSVSPVPPLERSADSGIAEWVGNGQSLSVATGNEG